MLRGLLRAASPGRTGEKSGGESLGSPSSAALPQARPRSPPPARLGRCTSDRELGENWLRGPGRLCSAARPRPAPARPLPGARGGPLPLPYLAGAASACLSFHALPSRGAAGPVPRSPLAFHLSLPQPWGARTAGILRTDGRTRALGSAAAGASTLGGRGGGARDPVRGSTRLQTQGPAGVVHSREIPVVVPPAQLSRTRPPRSTLKRLETASRPHVAGSFIHSSKERRGGG